MSTSTSVLTAAAATAQTIVLKADHVATLVKYKFILFPDSFITCIAMLQARVFVCVAV
jgi:hypothetical protein